jgi:ankyrin repeat protein
VHELIQAGAAVDNANTDGETPLMTAAYMGNFEVVQFLLQSGADMTKKDKYENSVLDRIKSTNHTSIIDLLEVRGGGEKKREGRRKEREEVEGRCRRKDGRKGLSSNY